MDISPQPTSSSFDLTPSTPTISIATGMSNQRFLLRTPHSQPPYAFFPQGFNSGGGFLLSSHSPSLPSQPGFSVSTHYSQLRQLLQQPTGLIHAPITPQLSVSHPNPHLFLATQSVMHPGLLCSYSHAFTPEQQQQLPPPPPPSHPQIVQQTRAPSLMSLQPRQNRTRVSNEILFSI